MKSIFLIKLGELTLRKQNLSHYIKALRTNIKRQLVETDASVESRDKRMYVRVSPQHGQTVRDVLDRTFGIAGYAEVMSSEKTVPGRNARSTSAFALANSASAAMAREKTKILASSPRSTMALTESASCLDMEGLPASIR